MNTGIPRSRRLTLSAAALALAVGLTACGGDGDDSASGEVDVTTWAGNVCGQLVAWGQELQSASTSVQSTLETTSGDLEAQRAQLVKFLGDAADSTDQMIERIDSAGTPRVDQGGEVADSLTSGLGEVKKAFDEGKAQAESIPADDPGVFAQRATEIGNQATETIQQEITQFDERYDIPALNQAFEEAPQCTAIAG